MDNKVTASPVGELLSECWSQIKADKITPTAAFGVFAAVSHFAGKVANVGSVITNQEVRSLIGKDLFIGILCAIAYLIVSAHLSIKKRDNEKIASLEGARGNLQISFDVDDHPPGHLRYLRGRIKNNGNTATQVLARIIGLRSIVSSAPETLDLKWSGSQEGPKDIPNLATEIFDIGCLQISGSGGAAMGVTGMLGSRSKCFYINAGKYELEIHITGTNIPWRGFKLPIEVSRQGEKNELTFWNAKPLVEQ